MNTPKPLNTLIVFGFLVSSLHGGVIPGRWEKVDALESGSKIVLTSQAGDRVRYTFQKSDLTSVRIKDRNGRELVIPKTHITQIVKQNPRSSKPAWIAAAAGAGVRVGMVLASGLMNILRQNGELLRSVLAPSVPQLDLPPPT